MKDSTIANKLGVTVGGIKKAVKALKNKGLVQARMRGYRQRTLESVWMNIVIPEGCWCVIRFPLKEPFKVALVRWAYDTSIETLNKKPTIGFIVKLTGMSPKTSRNYLKKIRGIETSTTNNLEEAPRNAARRPENAFKCFEKPSKEQRTTLVLPSDYKPTSGHTEQPSGGSRVIEDPEELYELMHGRKEG